MTVFHRTQKHLQTIAGSRNDIHDEYSFKGQGIPRRRRRSSFSKVREDLEDWLVTVACVMVILVCTLWFLGKVTLFLSWIFVSVREMIPTFMLFSGSALGNSVSDKVLKDMPMNTVYEIPHAHKLVGDRSHRYAILRKEIDSLFPEDSARSLQRVAELRHHVGLGVMPTIPLDHNSDQILKPAYDIYNCPDIPPEGYPFQWNLMKVVENWNPENTTVPAAIFNGLCMFDYQDDYEKAMTYRDEEVPFVMSNDPRIAATAERWNSPGYMEKMLGNVHHRTTRSDTNHFLYAVAPPKNKANLRKHNKPWKTAPPGWTDPTQAMRMSYSDWLEKANVTDDLCTPDQPHWYYRLIGCGLTGPDGSCDKGSSEYLYDEMPFFQPRSGGLYLRDAKKQKGIHCRFGQKGIVADNHFDAGRNTIVLLGGSRR